jgi:hypothetical protein
MDIEGGEYELLNAKSLKALVGACFIIELHEFTDEHRVSSSNLVQLAIQIGYSVSWINATGRNPYGITVLEDFSDHDRWLVCSEGRPNEMRWLVLERKR